MSWTSPRTWVANEVVTASLMNTHVRDNLLETAPAKVSAAGDILYATGANAIARLGSGSIASGAANPLYVVKSADQSLSTNTTLQNDDHLSKAIGANEIWWGELYLIVNTPAAADFKFAWTVPTSPTSARMSIVNFDNAAALTGTVGDMTAGQSGIYGTTAVYPFLPVYFYLVNGSNSGTLQLQWAQNSSSGTTTVYKGSHMRLLRVA